MSGRVSHPLFSQSFETAMRKYSAYLKICELAIDLDCGFPTQDGCEGDVCQFETCVDGTCAAGGPHN